MRLLLIAVIFLTNIRIANACAYASPDFEELYIRSDAIFTAVFMESYLTTLPYRSDSDPLGSVSVIGGFVPTISVFKVTGIIKPDATNYAGAEVDELVFVLQEASSCSVGFKVDVEYLIVGERVLSNTYTTSQSKGTKQLSDAASILEQFAHAAGKNETQNAQ